MAQRQLMCLPIVRPSLTVNPRIANLLAVLQRRPCGQRWAFTWFVELAATVVDNTYDVGLRRSIGFSTCPLVDTHWLTPQDIADAHGIEGLLLSELRRGRYVVAMFDHFWFSASIRYQRRHFVHNSMIVGYCEESEEFLAGDFFGRGYDFRRVSFNAVARAFAGVDKREQRLSELVSGHNSREAVAMSASRKRSSSAFSIRTLTQAVQDYVLCGKGVRLAERETEMYRESRGVRLGICFYDEVLRWLIGLYDGWTGEHVGRSMYKLAGLIHEHKRFMRQRVDWLGSHGYVEDEHLERHFRALERDAYILRNMLLKYEVRPTREALGRVIDAVARNRELDLGAMRVLLDSLRGVEGKSRD